MIQCKRALEKSKLSKTFFVNLEGNTLTVRIQDGTIPDVGVNGIQVADLLEFVKDVFVELNTDFPCTENVETIELLKSALAVQENRTKDREKRGVEGYYKE